MRSVSGVRWSEGEYGTRVERRDRETSSQQCAIEHAAQIWTWFANCNAGLRQMNGRISGMTDVSTQPARH
jgi:hypothetical protein